MKHFYHGFVAPLDDIKRINESKSYTNFGSFTLSVALLSSWAFPTALTLSAKLSIYYFRIIRTTLKTMAFRAM